MPFPPASSRTIARLNAAALIILWLCGPPLAAAELIDPATPLQDWQARRFSGQTRYAAEIRDGRQAICGYSQNSASALYRELDVDLEKTPILHWRWQLLQQTNTGDERSRAGDDFAARLYVLHSSGFWRFGLHALNYVWSQTQPPGSSWPNPFAGKRAMMLSLRSGQTISTGWIDESRNVRLDFARYNKREIEQLHGLAIMVDSDNHHGQAAACFADIHFAAE